MSVSVDEEMHIRVLAVCFIALWPIDAMAQNKTAGYIGIWSSNPPNSLTDTGNAVAPGELTVGGRLRVNAMPVGTQPPAYTSSVIGDAAPPEMAVYGVPTLIVGSNRLYQNTFLAWHDNDRPPGIYDPYPSAVSGVGLLHSAGAAVFGVGGHAELYTTSGNAVAAEFTAHNLSGVDADPGLPPDMAVPGYTPVAIGENVTCGVRPLDKDCSVGILIGNEAGAGSLPASPRFANAEYIAWFRHYGLAIGAQPTGSQVNINSASNGNGVNVVLQTTGPLQPNNAVLDVVDAAGTHRATIRQNGNAYVLGVHLTAVISAQLPPCANYNDGALYAVTDANAPAWNAVYAGGGNAHVLVLCNGTQWVVR